MKEEKLQLIPQKYKKKFLKKTHKRILWTVTCQQIWQPRRNGQSSRHIQAHQNWVRKKQITWVGQSLEMK